MELVRGLNAESCARNPFFEKTVVVGLFRPGSFFHKFLDKLLDRHDLVALPGIAAGKNKGLLHVSLSGFG